MRGRYPSTPGVSSYSYSFGPGPLTPAIKILIAVNVAVFVLGIVPAAAVALLQYFTLQPASVLWRPWQPLTYMFLHGGLFHLLFNMLALWMFGTELERTWGSRFFAKYYLVCGAGAALTTIVLAFVPGDIGSRLYLSRTLGASGAVFGVLLAYALYFPYRPILLFFLFPIPARYFVMIIGAIALYSSIGVSRDGIAHVTHLGGIVAGYLYLKGARVHLLSELQYRYLRWRINRSRKRFDVYQGGRKDVDRRVH